MGRGVEEVVEVFPCIFCLTPVDAFPPSVIDAIVRKVQGISPCGVEASGQCRF